MDAQEPRKAPEAGSTPEGESSPGQRWSDLHIWQVQYVRDALMILGIIALFWLGQKLSIVTVPVLLAILLAYLFEPVIQFLMRRTRLRRQGAVTTILVVVVTGVLVPGALALSYGVIQGVALVQNVVENTIQLRNSVEAAWNEEDYKAAYDEKEASEQAAAEIPASGEPGAGTDPGDDAGADGSGEEDAAEKDGSSEDAEKEPILVAKSVDPEELEEGSLDYLLQKIHEQRLAKADALENLRESGGESWVDLHDWFVEAGRNQNLSIMLDIVGQWLEAEAGRIAQAAAGVGRSAFVVVLGFLSGAFGILFMAFLTAFFFYFFATGWVEFKVFTRKLLPDKNRDQIIHFAVQFDRVIAAFIRGRLTIAFIQSIVFTIGYWLIGVPAAFILGPVVALLSIVPYLALVGVPVAILLLWLEDHTGLRGNILYVLAAPTVFYFIAQALDDYVWTPLIQGKETGMSTPAILFASLAGGVLFGVFGLLIAIPIAACLKILIQEVFWPRFRAWAEGEAKDFLPITRE